MAQCLDVLKAQAELFFPPYYNLYNKNRENIVRILQKASTDIWNFPDIAIVWKVDFFCLNISISMLLWDIVMFSTCENEKFPRETPTTSRLYTTAPMILYVNWMWLPSDQKKMKYIYMERKFNKARMWIHWKIFFHFKLLRARADERSIKYKKKCWMEELCLYYWCCWILRICHFTMSSFSSIIQV